MKVSCNVCKVWICFRAVCLSTCLCILWTGWPAAGWPTASPEDSPSCTLNSTEEVWRPYHRESWRNVSVIHFKASTELTDGLGTIFSGGCISVRSIRGSRIVCVGVRRKAICVFIVKGTDIGQCESVSDGLDETELSVRWRKDSFSHTTFRREISLSSTISSICFAVSVGVYLL